MIYSNLIKYGLTAKWEQEAALYSDLFLARIIKQHRDFYRAVGENGEMNAVLSGKLIHSIDRTEQFPAVGDWVMLDRMDDSSGNAVIHHILSRKSIFTRKAAGTANNIQVVAANVDTLFLCMALNADFNLRRMERYLTIAWDSGALPVIVLTKSDLSDDLQQQINEVESACIGVDILVCSTKESAGYEAVEQRIKQGETIAFIGSSGVGKSTLVNRLMGQNVLATKEIREGDDKGRHTTTHRELFLLPNGGLVIDTPGMRELQLYTGDLAATFEDIEELSLECKFRDCTHAKEPGCMVRQAIEKGHLPKERFANYQKMQRELAYDGLNSRQLEQEKLNMMFGSKAEMKQMMKFFKNKNK